jgi:hypothetical protein
VTPTEEDVLDAVDEVEEALSVLRHVLRRAHVLLLLTHCQALEDLRVVRQTLCNLADIVDDYTLASSPRGDSP